MHYVKDGQDPKPLSSDRTASPNTAWKAEQLAIHNITLVADPVVVPPEKTDEQKKDELIAAKTRELAVTALKGDGLLDDSGQITETGLSAATAIGVSVKPTKEIKGL
jgi:hypothetical protein